MMFSLSFAIVLLFTISLHGQPTNDINSFRINTVEKGYPFGKLRLSEDGKNEELIPTVDIEKTQMHQDQSAGIQPLPSPCVGTSSLTKIAYPKDKTKYIQCRDEYHYEIFTCPNGGEYNEQTNSCDFMLPTIDKCEQEKPCLNDGQCQLLSNSTFKCTCKQDWTGERCEIPMTSCVQKPCGPNAECRSLKTADYEQDYVCVCHGIQGYGLNCQEAVPNPCLSISEQFFPYAFSQRAYIQCDGDLIYFQPCGPLLYWNQEEKICDRKRPAKIDLSTLLIKLSSNTNQDEANTLITTTVQTEQQNSNNQNDKILAFVPARIGNRYSFQDNINKQQGTSGQTEQQSSSQVSPSTGSNQVQQGQVPKAKQWPHLQTPTVQSGQNQLWSQNTQQQQWTPSLTGALPVNTVGQQQTFPQQTQGFNNQQWLQQVPETNTQNNQGFGSQSLPSWQGSSITQNQPQFQTQSQTFFQTTTPPPHLAHLQGFNPSSQSSQSVGFGAQSNPSFVSQPQSWPVSQTNPSQSLSQSSTFFQTTTPSPHLVHLQGFNPASQSSQSIGFGTQSNPSFVSQPQAWPGSQTNPNQAQSQSQTFFHTTTPPPHLAHLQGFNPASQSPQSVGFGAQSNPSFVSQPQAWPVSQTNPSQPQSQSQSLFGTTSSQNLGFQGSSGQVQQQPSWQNTPNTQATGFQSVDWNSQNFLPQAQPWQKSQSSEKQPTEQTKGQSSNSNKISQNDLQSQASLIDIQLHSLNNGQSVSNQNARNQQSSSTVTKNSQSQNIPQQNQLFGSQQWLNQIPEVNPQKNQQFSSQSSWQGSKAMQNQPQFQSQHQQIFPETSTIGQNVNRFQGQAQALDQSWQPNQNQGKNIQSNKVIAFQPKQWTDNSKQTQQSLSINPSSDLQMNQYGLNQQQQTGLSAQNSFNLGSQTNQNFAFNPSFETTTALPNKGLQQGFLLQQGSNSWQQPSRLNEQRQTLDSIPTSYSG